jgi:hypothetical protein
MGARDLQPGPKRRCLLGKMIEENAIETRQAGGRVEILERQAESERKHVRDSMSKAFDYTSKPLPRETRAANALSRLAALCIPVGTKPRTGYRLAAIATGPRQSYVHHP